MGVISLLCLPEVLPSGNPDQVYQTILGAALDVTPMFIEAR